MRTNYTADQKADALRLLAEVGKAEAARRTGIPAGTIASWGSREGVAGAGTETMAPAAEAKALSLTRRKQALAEALLDDIGRLRAELFAPTTEKRAIKVGEVVEIVDIVHDRPSAQEQKHLVVACAVAIDKVQILTGGLTAHLGMTPAEPAAPPPSEVERRDRALAAVIELGQRAAAG